MVNTILRNGFALLILLTLFFWVVINVLQQKGFYPLNVQLTSANERNYTTKSPVSVKYVLAWAPTWYSVRLDAFKFNEKPFDNFKNCPVNNCAMTADRSKVAQVDAVLFVMTDVGSNDRPDPALRKEWQYYIFFLEESPLTTAEIWNPRQWDVVPHYFNLTYTYRLDADIFSDDYIDIYKPHLIDPSKREQNWFAKKRDVLWMVGHCNTQNKREDYVREMAKYISIDIMGKCGNNMPAPCMYHECKDAVFTSQWKFYASFENSMCKEYVTEKLIRALNNDVVPIVMGAARYDVLLPPKAVINVEDFASAKALTDYLKYLITNQSAYEEHLSWKYAGKELWQLNAVPKPTNSGFCKICELLNRPPETRIKKSYGKVVDWLFENQCRKPFVKYHFNSSDYNATMYVD